MTSIDETWLNEETSVLMKKMINQPNDNQAISNDQ